MYLVVDIGNTNIVFALLDKNLVKYKWRISTDINRTSDEYYIWLSTIIKNSSNIKAVIIGSVVPEATEQIKDSCYSYLKKKVFIINEDIKINFPIKVENKKEVGTDRLVNSLAAWSLYKQPSIIIDFGTATTFDVIIKNKYLGGIIAPGVSLSLNTLVSKASLIPSLKLKKVKNILGKTTISAVRSGFYWGYVGLVENIIDKISKHTNKKYKLILTGGYSHLFIKSIKQKAHIDKDITIKGLLKIAKYYER